MSVASREADVLDAMRTCFGRWGIAKTTIDDIAKESGISRASLYRMYPGGRTALVAAYRRQNQIETAEVVRSAVATYRREAVDPSAHGLLARVISVLANQLQDTDSVGEMFLFAPELASAMTDALPQTIELATERLSLLLHDFLPPSEARHIVDMSLRLLLSYRFIPSDHLDLRDEEHALRMLAPLFPSTHPTAETSAKD